MKIGHVAALMFTNITSGLIVAISIMLQFNGPSVVAILIIEIILGIVNLRIMYDMLDYFEHITTYWENRYIWRNN